MTIDNIIRAISLILMGIIVAFLSETISKSEGNLRESKVRERNIKKLKDKYEEAYNRAEFYKDLFTHDMNNILQNILLGMDLCFMKFETSENYDEIKEISTVIRKHVLRGANLISNIRKISQLEEPEYQLKQIEICKILKKSIKIIKRPIQGKNINIQVDSVCGKLYIQANNLLEDVFENILNNAVKFNENPIVEIYINISRILENNINYVKMEFLDNGIGIDDSIKKKIFERGYKKDISVKGMGLGLSLVKAILTSYNGFISIEDKLKGDYTKGSNFIIKIPEGCYNGKSIHR